MPKRNILLPVSYTHLDVYKRQIEDLKYAADNLTITSTDKGRLTKAAAVSYTHLDVYKRQA